MSKKKCYLAGGMEKFGKSNFDESNIWRLHIQQELEELPVEVCNPNDYYNFKDTPPKYDSNREVMEFDFDKVRKSDFIIVNFNDVYSRGTMAEITIAYEHRIPVIGLVSKDSEHLLHSFQEDMCRRIFNDIDELIDYVIDYYIY